MANIDQAFGLRPIAKLGSVPGGTTGTTKILCCGQPRYSDLHWRPS